MLENMLLLLKSYKNLVKQFYSEIYSLFCKHTIHFCVLIIVILSTLYQYTIYKHSTCVALLCFNNLCLLNVFRVVCHLSSLWSDSQSKSTAYSYGLVRVRVLLMFSCLILMTVLAIWNLKIIFLTTLDDVSVESIFDCFPRSNVFLFGIEVVALTCLVTVTKSGESVEITGMSMPSSQVFFRLIRNFVPTHYKWAAFDHLASIKKVWPKSLLCPVVTLSIFCWMCLFLHSIYASVFYSLFSESATLIQLSDAICSLLILLAIGSCLIQPFYTSFRILMQGMVYRSSIQRSLLQATTVEGVLEMKQVHVWCLVTGSTDKSGDTETFAGNILVRLHRNADVSLVSKQLVKCLQGVIRYLTLQVYKDDWLIQTCPPSSVNTSPVGYYDALKSDHHYNVQDIDSHLQLQLDASADINKSDDQKTAMKTFKNSSSLPIKITETSSPYYVNIEYPQQEGYDINTSQYSTSSSVNALEKSSDFVSSNSVSYDRNCLRSNSPFKKFEDHSYVNIDYSTPFELR